MNGCIRIVSGAEDQSLGLEKSGTDNREELDFKDLRNKFQRIRE